MLQSSSFSVRYIQIWLSHTLFTLNNTTFPPSNAGCIAADKPKNWYALYVPSAFQAKSDTMFITIYLRNTSQHPTSSTSSTLSRGERRRCTAGEHRCESSGNLDCNRFPEPDPRRAEPSTIMSRLKVVAKRGRARNKSRLMCSRWMELVIAGLFKRYR